MKEYTWVAVIGGDINRAMKTMRALVKVYREPGLRIKRTPAAAE